MRARWLGLMCFLWLGASNASAAVEPSRGWIPERYRAQLLQMDSLYQVRKTDQAHAIAAALLKDARARGDSAAQLLLLRADGDMWSRQGLALRAEPLLKEALGLATTLRDSAALCRVNWLLANTVSMLGRSAESTALYQRALEIALALGDRGGEGRARTGLAFASLQAGDARAAIEEYRLAGQRLHEAGDWRAELNTLIGLGRAHSQLGEYDRSQECNLKVAEIAHARGDYWSEGHALNNLGTLEYSLGDPGAAMGHFRQAFEIYRRVRNPAESITPAHNIALCDRDLGRFDDAAAILTSALDTCEANGFRDQRSRLLTRLAEIRIGQGRPREAVVLARRAAALDDSTTAENRLNTLLGLAHALVAVDSGRAALEVLEGGTALRARANPAQRIASEGYRGQLLFDAKRYADARACATEADREAARLGLDSYRATLLTTAGCSEQALGRPDSALALLERAAALWEAERGVPLDPEWRERRGSSVRRLARASGELALEHPRRLSAEDRARQAFDRLQRFKGRTLAERMQGPAGAGKPGAPEGITVERLQRGLLREGDLLLDAYTDLDTTLLFAVTRTRCRALRLPGERALAPRLRLFRDLLASPAEGAGGALPAAASSLGRLLLGGCADLLAPRGRILFVPDGCLNLIPIGALAIRAERGEAVPLLRDHEIVIYPSAGLIPRLRSRIAGVGRGPVRMLAVATLVGPDSLKLEGAAGEARRLGRRFRDVDVRVTESRASHPPAPEDLAAYGALHFAAHTAVDDQHPWRSGILLADAAGGGDAWLRASRIASLSLPARLAVLSGCESAGGRVLSGEGVLGLTAAFMSAGVPAIVATLWPVDDRATAAFMSRFYDGLARGRTAAAALREAQNAVHAERRTRAPFYWAGFVLLGEGDVRIPLRRRAAWPGARILLP